MSAVVILPGGAYRLCSSTGALQHAPVLIAGGIDEGDWYSCDSSADEPEECVIALAHLRGPELLAALKQCLPIVDAHRRAARGEGDIAAMNARAYIDNCRGPA